MKNKRLIGLLCALGATLCWASNYPVSRLIFNCDTPVEVDEWWSAWVRNFFCAASFLPFTFVVKGNSWGHFAANWKRDWKIFLFLGIMLVGEGALCFAAAKYTTAARTSLFANTSPVFTLLISFIFAKEVLSGRKVTGVLMGLAGIIIAAVTKGGDVFSAGGATLWGDLLALVSGIFWATFTVFGGDASSKYSGIFCTAMYRMLGLTAMLPVLFFCNISFNLPLTVWLGLVYMAVISGGVAVWMWSFAQKYVEPGVLGSFGYISAFCATSFSMIFLKEKITLPFVIAFVLILGGMMLILKPVKGEKKPQSEEKVN